MACYQCGASKAVRSPPGKTRFLCRACGAEHEVKQGQTMDAERTGEQAQDIICPVCESADTQECLDTGRMCLHCGEIFFPNTEIKQADPSAFDAPSNKFSTLPEEPTDLEGTSLDLSESEEQPEPEPGGDDVPKDLLAWIKVKLGESVLYGHDLGEQLKEAYALVTSRRLVGTKKYGCTLHTDDGRDHLEDARQEAGDLMQYIHSLKMQGRQEALDEVRELVDVIQMQLEE